MESKNVIYVSRAGLPIDATGARIEQIGKLFERSGYTIHYLCECRWNKSIEENGYVPIVNRNLEGALNPKEVHVGVGKHTYSYLPKFSGNKLSALFEMIEIVTSYRACKRIKRYIECEKPSIVVLYNMTSPLQRSLISYCKKRDIMLLGDITEWYERKEHGSFVENYIVHTTDYRIRKLDQKLDGIISISPFLYEYYSAKGVSGILIPPLMSQLERGELPKKAEDEPICFVYAGSPGAKDIIVPFIKAVEHINTRKIKCKIDVIGVDAKFLQQNGCLNEGAHRGVFAHGRLPRQKTLEIVKNADFGILFRHNQRYAKAGFSTKLAECMSCGVGMVCNSIGGSDLFVSDGEDGFLLSNIEDKTLFDFLDRITQLDRKQIDCMKKCALKKAQKLFALETYQEQFNEFLKKVYENGCKKNR